MKSLIHDWLLADWFTKSLFPPFDKDVSMAGDVTKIKPFVMINTWISFIISWGHNTISSQMLPIHLPIDLTQSQDPMLMVWSIIHPLILLAN
jgi:hypothetical protein